MILRTLKNTVIRNNIMLCIIYMMILVLSDQIAKIYIYKYFSVAHSPVDLLPILRLTLVWNYGVSFGIFSKAKYALYVGIFVIILFCIIMYILIKHAIHSGYIWHRITAILIAGGGIGNLLDRVHYGAVLDFIDFYYKDYHFPAFNLADCYIFCGAVLFIIFYNAGNRN